MPMYEYEHDEKNECPRGGRFLLEQSIREDAIRVCPTCGTPVSRLIRPAYIRAPISDTDLRDKGFAKLVRRDKGVYENVTALHGESRVWEAGKSETMPDIRRRIRD